MSSAACARAIFFIRLYSCIRMEKSYDHGQNNDRLAPKTGKKDTANNPAVRGVEVKINKTGRLIQYVYLLICKLKKIIAKLSLYVIKR